MENNSLQEQIQEICYIYHKRNLLGRERDRLRHKLRYLQDIKRSLQVRDNYKSSPLYRKARNSFSINCGSVVMTEHDQVISDALAVFRQEYLKRNPIPKQLTGHSLSQINMMILEANAKLCQIKAKIMKHTHKYDKRLKRLLPNRWSPSYVCGIVRNITIYSNEFTLMHITNLEKYHDEFVANEAVDKMLRS